MWLSLNEKMHGNDFDPACLALLETAIDQAAHSAVLFATTLPFAAQAVISITY